MAFNSAKKITKVSFKQCPPSTKKLFATSNCIMPISVGQKIHEGEKFFATLKLINASFKECTLLIDDSIQRHTMKIQSAQNEKTLYALAVQAGDEWLIRNAPSYKCFDIPYTILRWDDWLQHPGYSSSYEKITDYYNNNFTYKDEIHKSIEEFLARYTQKLENKNDEKFDYEKAFNYCADYLKEECAIMCLWAESGYAFEVYPSGRNRAMIATYELIVRPAYPEVLKSISLYFEKYPVKAQPIPQLES